MADDPGLLDRAAACYLIAKEPTEAARCYRDAGSHRRAADLYARVGLYREAADAYADAKMHDFAIWHLAHHIGDVAGARALENAGRPAGGVSQLRWRLAVARCAIAEQRPDSGPLGVLADACGYLERPLAYHDENVELWAVALAMAMKREDQVALLYAAGVRGHHGGAGERWAAWSRDTLRCELILPTAEPGSPESPAN